MSKAAKEVSDCIAGIKDGEKDNAYAHEHPISFALTGGPNKGKSGDRDSSAYHEGYKEGLSDRHNRK